MTISAPREWRRRDAWLAILSGFVLATIALHSVRENLQQAHVVLVYMLIVLAGSAFGGRTLGFLLAVASFFAIDYFFQTPFDQFSVGNPVDWFVLVAFLLTAALAAILLARAQAAAERAEYRTQEVARLSRLGAELLGSGTAESALTAIAEKVRDTAHADRCAVYSVSAETTPARLEALVALGGDSSSVDATDLAFASEALATGEVIARPHESSLRSLAIPLRVHERSVGVLTVASGSPLLYDDAARRFLDALSYYAALAVERVALVAQLEHAEAARETARVREALLASVSHDLRTPLTTIKILAQESATRGDLEVATQNATVIEEQIDRLHGIVSNLLDLTRLRSAAFSLHAEVNAADDLVGAVARQVRGILGDHALVREIDDRGAVLLGHFDFVQTQRILVNLVENAARYAPTTTPITLRVWRDDEWLRFSVSDRGPGIALEEHERIFEPFYRGATASADSGGVGLGLYISRALAEAQGGHLELTSSPAGSTFLLSLRAVDAPAIESDSDVTNLNERVGSGTALADGTA